MCATRQKKMEEEDDLPVYVAKTNITNQYGCVTPGA